MKRITVFLLILTLSFLLLTPVSAQSAIEITRQPQNSVFPENGSADWSVEAKGSNLVYEWFIFYKGVSYNTAKSFEENHPWQEGIVGDGYGWSTIGNEFFINGIGSALDGAEIYCVVSNEACRVTSQSAYISISGKKSPPRLTVPASASVEQNKSLKLYCSAEAFNGDTIKSYTWYETATGELRDIVAIGTNEGRPQASPTLVCDTSKTGTRYYVCYIQTTLGGRAYSSVIPVTVTPKKTPPSELSKSESSKSAGNSSSNPSDSGSVSSAQESSLTESAEETEEERSITESSQESEDALSAPQTSGSADESENLPDSAPGKAGFSPLLIVLIIAGCLLIVGGGVTGIIVFYKTKKK